MTQSNCFIAIFILTFGCVDKPKPSQQINPKPLVSPLSVSNEINPKSNVPESKNLLPDQALRQQCCKACDEASGKDPTGRDISMKACQAYSSSMINGQALLSEACIDFFDANSLTVSDCR